MSSLNIGYIQEIKKSNKKKYLVSLLNELDSTLFNTVKEAIMYFKKHVIRIFDYKNINSLHIKYLHLNNFVHYLIFKKNQDNEIILYEESKFDFLRTRPHKISKYKLRRIINEKNYSFSDVYRASINWHPFYSIWNTILSLFLLISSGFFLIYGLDFINLNQNIPTFWDELFLFISFFASIITILFLGFIQQKTRFTLFQTSGDFKEINWRKWYSIRINQLLLSIFVFLISIFIICFFLYKAFINNDNDFKIILFINFAIWNTYFISSFFMLLFSQYKKRKTLHKYFSKPQIKVFKKWARNSNEKEIFKTKDIFLFHNDYSNRITRKSIDETIEIMSNINLEYLWKLRKNELNVRLDIIKWYTNFLKEKKNECISKNNK